MGERKHKADGGEKKDKLKPGVNPKTPVTHSILQLQQSVGNIAVTKIIQRQKQEGGQRAEAVMRQPNSPAPASSKKAPVFPQL